MKSGMRLLAVVTAVGTGVVCAETSDRWSINLIDEFNAMSQMAMPTNSWACSQGGSWNVTANGTDIPYNTHNGMVGFRASSGYPMILANVTSAQQSGPAGGNGVSSGEFYYHPASSGTDIIRYTAAEEGTFSVTGIIRRVNNDTRGNGVRLWVYAGGRQLTNVIVSATGTSYPFAATVSLLPGGTLEVALDSNSGYSYDATGFRCFLLRTGAYLPPVTSDAADALRVAAAGETVSNPVVRVCGKPGTWRFLRRTASSDSLMSCLMTDKTYFRGVVNDSSSSFPRLLVNTATTAQTPTDASAPVQPGEMFYHSENDQNNKTVLSYTAERTGWYSFSGRVRDRNSGGGNGVGVAVYVNDILRTSFVVPKGGDESFESESSIPMVPGSTVELVLDSNGGHPYDATGVGFAVTFDVERPGVAEYSLVQALRENVCSANPDADSFTASDGGVWSFGHYGKNAGFSPDSFTAFSEQYESENFRGWKLAGQTTQEYAVSTNGLGGTVNGKTCTAREIAYHPFTETYSACRFHAPRAGIYSFLAYLTAVNADSRGNGLDASIVVNGSGYPAFGIACANGAEGSTPAISLPVKGIWLGAGETVDFAVGPNGDIQFDASVLSGAVTREGDLPETPVVNFDICGTDRAAFSGRGRVGTGETWTKLSAGALVSACPSVEGVKVKARLTLSRAAGSAAIADVPAAIADGVVSESESDPVGFAVEGLAPGATYEFYAYSRNASGAQGVFVVGGVTNVASQGWFARSGGDMCSFSAAADGNGTVNGVFTGSEQGAATFTALQVMGDEFPLLPRETIIVFQ